jgi:hypothetical protein
MQVYVALEVETGRRVMVLVDHANNVNTVKGFVTLSEDFVLLIATQFLENYSLPKQV